MKKIFVTLLVIMSGCAYSDPWEHRNELKIKYVGGVYKNINVSDVKKELDAYDNEYRKLSLSIINSTDDKNKRTLTYGKICKITCGPLINIIDGYKLPIS